MILKCPEDEINEERSKRLAAERELGELKARVRDYLLAANDWTWEQDANFRFTEVNAYRQIPFLNNASEALGRTRWEVFDIDPAQDEHWARHVADLKAHRSFRDFRYSLIDMNGLPRTFSVSGIPFFGADGVFRGYRGTVTDITELAETQEANERFRHAIDHVSEGFAIWGPDERLVMHNAQMTELSGLPEDVLKPGLTFEGWIRARLDIGMIPEQDNGNTERWIAERLELFRAANNDPIDVLRNGRWYRLQYVKLVDGSTVQTINDIDDYKSSQHRFELASSLAKSGVFEWDVEKGNAVWSDSFFHLLGLEPGEVRPSVNEFYSRIHPEDRDLVRRASVDASEKGKEFSLECRFVRANDETFWANVKSELIEAGGTKRWFGFVTDIDDQKAAEKLKAEFTSTVSHELRTPVTAIKGALDLISSGTMGDLPEKVAYLADIATRNSERLVMLVNDILDIEKLDAGHIQLQTETVSVCDLMKEACELNSSFARELGVELVCLPSGENFTVLADRARTQQIFANLISNAVKFSKQGGKVEVFAQKAGGFGQFGVRDHGCGISPEFLPKLFERFTQEDASDSRSKGGTGLGLTITKSLVEIQGGEIFCQSQPGVGTDFSFTLPVSHETAL